MRAAAFLFEAFVGGAVLLVKIRDLLRDPRNPFIRWLCAMLGCVTACAILAVPTVLTYLQASTGILAVWLLCPLIGSCFSSQTTMQHWFSPLDEVKRKVRVGVIFYAGASALMIFLAIMGRNHSETSEILIHKETPEALWGTTPYVRDLVLVFHATMTVSMIDSARYCLRSAKLVDRRWLRRALMTVFASCIGILSYCAAMIAYYVLIRYNILIPSLISVAVLSAVLAVTLIGVGITMPVMGPRWDRMVAYHQLRHLWLALRRVIPDIVLDPPWSVAFDACNPYNVDFRIYRRVIEIRDGILALRPYFDQRVATIARGLGVSAQLSSSQLEAVIMATQLTMAIEDRLRGHDLRECDYRNGDEIGGDNLDDEVRTLGLLAQAYRDSDLVKVAVQARRQGDAT